MRCTELTTQEMVATVAANNLLVTTQSAINLGDRSLPPALLLSARLRALARLSATTRTAIGGLASLTTDV